MARGILGGRLAPLVRALDFVQQHFRWLFLEHYRARAALQGAPVRLRVAGAGENEDRRAACPDPGQVIEAVLLAKKQIEHHHVRPFLLKRCQSLWNGLRRACNRHSRPFSIDQLPQPPEHVLVVVYEQHSDRLGLHGLGGVGRHAANGSKLFAARRRYMRRPCPFAGHDGTNDG